MHWLKFFSVRSNQNASGGVIIVLVLCVSIFMQMLGVPATLLAPSVSADNLTASLLEGFSIPPALPGIELLSRRTPHFELSPSVHVPVLSSSLFRPPVR